MKRVTILAFFLSLMIGNVVAQEVVPLYGTKIPGSKTPPADYREAVVSGTDGVSRVSKVTDPTLTVYAPAKGKSNGTAVIICPGGGYGILAFDKEGTKVAEKFTEMGITAFVLKYRLPSDLIMEDKSMGPLQDALQAIYLVRKNANLWGVNANKVGIMGFSAGGHLAASVSNISTDYTALKGDWQNFSAVPDFAILISPVIDLGEFAHKGSRDNLLGENASPEKIKEYSMQNRVTDKTPPTILFHAQNDPAVPVINSVLYYEAMIQNKVKGALFIFPKGEHNIGIANKTELTDNWKKICADWLTQIDK